MKPPPFRYMRPESVGEAIAGLTAYGDDAKLLAGGQSLLPMMNFRLARPAVLVDLDRVPGLDAVAVDGPTLSVGAMARQADTLRSTTVATAMPVLATALRHVGHHQIRTRGTIGGSLAHADPAAEVPALALLTGAAIVVEGPGGRRVVAAEDFFHAPFTTALADDEVLTEVRFPLQPDARWAFEELSRRRGDFAIAGVAGMWRNEGVRLVAFGLGWVPQRLRAAEATIARKRPVEATIRDAAAAARNEVEPMSDVHADAPYRRDAVAVLVARALKALHA